MKNRVQVAKVITTSFLSRVVREKTELTGNPLGFFSHSQNFTTPESIIELIKFNIEKELQCDPGANVDLIIVNNDTGWEAGKLFLDSIDQMKLKHGRIHTLNRKNFGRSFGGYNFAFQKLQDMYDYFIFTEDDILIAENGYASSGIEVFQGVQDCGFVAYQSLSDESYLDLSKEDTIHAHGGVGMSSSKILKEVVARYNSLPHSGENSSQEYTDIIRNGEVDFTNKISKLGYRLVNIPVNMKLYSFIYDDMRGMKMGRYASFLEKLKYRIKLAFYKVKVVRLVHQLYQKSQLIK